MRTFTIDGEEYKFFVGGRLTIATPKLIKEAFDQLDNGILTAENKDNEDLIYLEAIRKKITKDANHLFYRAYKCGAIP